MEKIYGDKCCTDGIYRIGRNKWQLVYGEGKDNDADNSAYYWRHRFDHKPTAGECRALIKETINAETESKILSGFAWRGIPVWLSAENQYNYKAAYDLAVQTDGATLPARFKFGTDTAPVYQTFDTVAELAKFYTAAFRHISDALADGWAEKDCVDAMPFDTAD